MVRISSMRFRAGSFSLSNFTQSFAPAPGVLTYPHIAADDGVALEREVVLFRRRHVQAFQGVKRECRDGVHLVVSTVHNELYACGYLTELADNEPVAVPIVQVRHMAFKIRVCDIGELADANVRIFERGLNIYFVFVPGNGVHGVWVGSNFHGCHRCAYRCRASFQAPTALRGWRLPYRTDPLSLSRS